MKNRLGPKTLDGFRQASDRSPNRVCSGHVRSDRRHGRGYCFSTVSGQHQRTLDITNHEKGITLERLDMSYSFGLRLLQEQASLLGDHCHIVGTPDIGTTAIASVPVVEGCTS